MKKLFILGLCALFMACSNSAQHERETAGPDPNTDTMSTARPVASVAPAASTDTSGTAAPADKAATAPAATPAAATKAAPAEDNAALVKKGEALYSQLDCFACHQMKVKMVGPAYADVAKKYPNTPANVNYLVGKIKKGGSGVWGEVPMTPHPALSDDDARALVQYVLSAK